MTTETAVGLDLGNTNTNVCIFGKFAKIPSRVAFECPPGAISQKTGQELKPKAFSLLFSQKEITVDRWFGQDVLATGAIQKLDMAKYDANHITVLFRAALYQWGKTHRRNLATLGKLNIVASMPPGLFKDPTNNRQAAAAFRKAFNRGQSHLKVRDEKQSIQIVTQFQEIVREAVTFGQVFRDGEHILTVDIGGFTIDFALFNGSYEPVWAKSDNNGLLTAYANIDNLSPAQAELKILRNKKIGLLPHQLTTFYNEVERKIQLITLRWPNPIKKIYVIGGGAALMPQSIKASFIPLADKVIFKNEYANCEANWHKAGGK